MSASREDIVREAHTWVGTPYAHRQQVKGAGVDCAWLLLRVYGDLELIPAVDPGQYAAQWFLHRDDPIYLKHVQQHARQVEQPLPGDVAMYSFGRHAAHGAIIVDEHSLIHAYMPAGRVILDGRAAYAPRLHSYWSVFL